MGKNIRSLQLLRNTHPFTSKEAAIAGIKSRATNDGTVKLARYSVNGEVKTVFGICYNPSEDTSSEAIGFSYTIYDSPQEVIEALEGRIKANKDAIDVLNGADTVSGSVAKSIKDAIDALEAAEVGGTGKVITTISESGGVISATAIDLVASAVSATAITASTESVAVSGTNVQAQVESLAKSIKTAVKDAKSYSISAITGDSLTALGANVKEAYKLVDEDGTQAGAPIKIYRDSSLKEVKLVGQELKFTYILADGSESTVGVDVSTFLAESEFKNGLEVVDHLVNVKIDAASESFLTVGEGGVKLSGVQNAINTAANKAATEVVEDAVGHVTVTKSTGANGQAIYTIGENDIASDAALTAEVTRAKAAEDKIEASVGLDANGSHVATSGNYTSAATTIVGEIAALDAQVKTNADAIAANKIAIEASLASEVTARKTVDGVDGDVYPTQTNANYISGASSLFDADVKLDAAIKDVADTAAKAHTEVKAKADGHVQVTVSESEGYTHDVVTVHENDIASESATTAAINAEKSARETEDTKIVAGVGLTLTEVDGTYKYKIPANTGTGASVSAASTVKDAIYTLDNALAAAKKANALTAADDTVVVTSGANGTTVKVNIASAETVTNFVGYAADGRFIKSNMFGTIDAGTY